MDAFEELQLDRLSLIRRTAGVAAAVGTAGILAPGAAARPIRHTARAAKAPKLPKTFVYTHTGPVLSINPDGAGQNDLPSQTAWTAAYDQLVDFFWPIDFKDTKRILTKSGVTGLVKPMLATSWESAQNNKVFRFHLRPNVKSQYGNTLNADDVLFSMQKAFAAAATNAFILRFIGSLASAAGVKKIDNSTVEFTLSQPQDQILLALGFHTSPIYDSTEARKHATSDDPYANTWLARNTAGYGPYKMTAYSPDGSSLSFQRRDDYWGPKPDVKQFVQRSIPEGSNRLQLLATGDAHYAPELTPVELTALQKRGIRITRVQSSTSFTLHLTQNPPWNDPANRAAVARAIPYDSIIKNVFRGMADPLRSVLSPFVPGYTEEFWRYKTDVNAAKAVLSKLPGLTITYRDGRPNDEAVAILVQAGLRSAGLDAQLEKVPSSVFVPRRAARTLQSFIESSATPGVPTANYYFLVYGGNGGFFNFYRYSNPKLEAAIYGTTRAEPELRKQAARDGQKIFMDDLVFIPIAFTGNTYAMSPLLQLPVTHIGNGIVHWPDFKIVTNQGAKK